MEKLKPCPRCGNTDLHFITNVITMRTMVMCKRCGSDTAFKDSTKDAIADWNRRIENGHND